MMNIEEIADIGEFRDMVEFGYIRVQRHQDGELTIYNYADKTAHEGMWNSSTLMARGLILDNAGNVVARPISKFFNIGEKYADSFESIEPVHVVDKMDGSLGIAYYHRDRWCIATRGSFQSEQAMIANMMLSLTYRDNVNNLNEYGLDWTALFEIIYPDNRIVVDYEDAQKLVYLGHVNKETERMVDQLNFDWPDKAEYLGTMPFREALELTPRPNKEGVVISSVDGMRHVKLKQDDYVLKHRVMTNLSPRRIWEYAAVLACKDEMKPWVMAQRFQMREEDVREIIALGREGLEAMLSVAPEEYSERILKELDEHHREVIMKDLELRTLYRQFKVENPGKAWYDVIKDNFDGLEQAVLFSFMNGRERISTLFKMRRP